jgi:hypothetical protein
LFAHPYKETSLVVTAVTPAIFLIDRAKISGAQKEFVSAVSATTNDEVRAKRFRQLLIFDAIVARLRDGGGKHNDQLSEAHRNEHAKRRE